MKNVNENLPNDFDEIQLQQMFDQGVNNRGTYESKWRECADYTLPYVYLGEDSDTESETVIDYQATGAHAATNLASKLGGTMFNPSQPFFRINKTTELIREASQRGLDDIALDSWCADTEEKSNKLLEQLGLRTSLLGALRSLVITGNSMVWFPSEGKKAQTYNLSDYVIKRDLSGEVVYIITRDQKSMVSLPNDLQELCMAEGLTVEADTDVSLYTGIFRMKDNRYVVKQEVNNLFIVPRQKGVYTKDNLPWIPLTWNLLRGNDYGNGLVEEYLPAFRSLSNMATSLNNMIAIASDIKGLVDPMGSTDVQTLNDSEPGTWCYGNRDDLDYLNLEKSQDMKFLYEQMQALKQEISRGFLVGTSATRDAERVTTSEIDMNERERHESLVAVYARFAEELQQPVAIRLLTSLDSNTAQLVDISITSGVDTISRMVELEQLRAFLQDLTYLNEVPEDIREWLKPEDLAKQFANHRHVDVSTFVKSKDEKAKEDAEKQERAVQLAGMIKQAEGEGENAANPQM